MAKRMPKFDKQQRIWCYGCEQYIAPRFFGKYTGDTPPGRCKKCRSKAAHATRIKATYGITAEAYQMLLDHQDGLCAICRRPSKVRRLAVDHDHQTGLVRGLLCRHCNYELLGWAKDDPGVFQRAIDYLADPPLSQVIRSRGDAP